MIAPDRLGEVIETSTVAFTAQSGALHELPPLGALVRVCVGEGGAATDLYGVVSFGQTAGVDAGRRPVRRGGDEVEDDAIYREHPELIDILRTTFSARLVGFKDRTGHRGHLPPTPPPLHYSVRACPPDDVRAFTGDFFYLRLLLATEGEVAPEQLLAAHLRAVHAARGDDTPWLEAAARAVARLLRDDADRLLTVLHAIDTGFVMRDA